MHVCLFKLVGAPWKGLPCQWPCGRRLASGPMGGLLCHQARWEGCYLARGPGVSCHWTPWKRLHYHGTCGKGFTLPEALFEGVTLPWALWEGVYLARGPIRGGYIARGPMEWVTLPGALWGGGEGGVCQGHNLYPQELFRKRKLPTCKLLISYFASNCILKYQNHG